MGCQPDAGICEAACTIVVPTEGKLMNAPDSADQPHRQRMNYRAQHRARSHESAHAEGDDHHAHNDDVKNALVPPRNAPLIGSKEGLAELLAHLRQMGQFAYDSEFIGELTYIPK